MYLFIYFFFKKNKTNMRRDTVPSKMDFKGNLYGENSQALESNKQLRGYVDRETFVKVLWCEEVRLELLRNTMQVNIRP